MIKTEIKFSKDQYEKIRKHLLRGPGEGAAFAFSSFSNAEGSAAITVSAVDLIPKCECLGETDYGIELSDIAWNRVMANAFKSKMVLVEMHSHPFSSDNVAFSPIDINGLKNLVPQLWWRLENQPYVALVFGRSSVDALLWTDSPEKPQAVECLNVEGEKIKPTGLSISYFHRSLKDG